MDIKKILNEGRSSQATIGLTKREFLKLLPYFEKELTKKRRRKNKNPKKAGRKPVLETSEIKLFFILFYLKTYPTFDVLAINFNMHRSNACRWVHFYVEILIAALKSSGSLPKRKFKNKNDFINSFPNLKLVITDGTERRRRRPKNGVKQKEFYSGKKNSYDEECMSL